MDSYLIDKRSCLAPINTMGDTARRTTRASVNEQLSAEMHDDKSAGSELNFEDFVRNSLSVLWSKFDTIIAGQAELEKKWLTLKPKST